MNERYVSYENKNDDDTKKNCDDINKKTEEIKKTKIRMVMKVMAMMKW